MANYKFHTYLVFSFDSVHRLNVQNMINIETFIIQTHLKLKITKNAQV